MHYLLKSILKLHLTTIEEVLGTFGRVFVPQKLINLSLYQEILLLQKFNGIGGKVLKPKIISLHPQKRMRPIFGEQTSQILEPSPQGLISRPPFSWSIFIRAVIDHMAFLAVFL